MTAVYERKELPPGAGDVQAMTGVLGHDDVEGTITAIVAVTGVRDRVGDIIVPGAITKALTRLKPKGVSGHDWKRLVSKADVAVELMPGDPRLPPTTADGDPWPAEAGGLLVKARYNLATEDGRTAYENAKFLGLEQAFSIGYKVLKARTRGGVRYILDLVIYEFSQVLHGAHGLAALVGVKSLLDSPEQWYTDGRSDDFEGNSLSSDYTVEYKAAWRTVKDPEYWGKPLGAIIRPGEKPRGKKARAQRRAGRTPDPRAGTADVTTVTDETPALIPESAAGAQRVKPRRGKRERSDDPAGDLVSLLAATSGFDQSDVDPLLDEVLDDALSPAEFEDELRDAAADVDVDEIDLEEVLDDYRARYRARLAQDTGRPAVPEYERVGGLAKPEAPAAAEPERSARPPLTTADYERIKKNSHPAYRDAALRQLTNSELAVIKHESQRRGKRAESMQDSVRTEERYRRLSPKKIREEADRMGGGGAYDSMVRRLHERAEDYERRDAAGIGRHDFEALPYGEQPPTTVEREPTSEEPTDKPFSDLERRLRAVGDSARGTVGALQGIDTGGDPLADTAGIGGTVPPSTQRGQPEVNLNDLSTLDDAELATALDNARREHRRLVVNGVPRNSTAYHDAKRTVTMLEDEQRIRARRPAPSVQDRLHEASDRASLSGKPQLAAYLAPFLAPDADIRTSQDGALAAVQGPRWWVLAETETGNPLPHLPDDLSADQVDAALAELGALDIPWGDREATQQRWSDPARKAADQRAVRAVVARHSRPAGETPPKEFAPEAGAVISEQQRGEPVPTSELPAPTEVPQPASGAAEIRAARADAEDAIADQDRDALADALTRMGVGTGDDDRDPHDVAASMLAIPTEVQQQRLDRMVQAATMVAEPTFEEAASQAERNRRRPDVNWGKPYTEDAAYMTPDGPVWMFRKGQRVRFYDAGGEQVGPEQANVGPASAYALNEGWRPPWATDASPETPTEAVITPDQQADAEAVRGDTLGLVEAEDGELEVTEEVAQRQDRIEALIESGPATLDNRSVEELGGTRRDLVSELALQDEIRRRDAARRAELRRQRGEQVSAPAGETGAEQPPPDVTGPRPRPGLTGALEDLADRLNERGVTASDDPDVRAAAERVTTVLRRNRSDSPAVEQLRRLLGADVHAQIAAGKLRPGVLLGLAERLRQEARDRRNAAARARRLVRRLERERIRSLIGTVDALLRRRGRDPEEFGGPLPAPTLQRGSAAAATDMGDLAQHQRPPELVADDQASQQRVTRAVELIREAQQASADGDHARAVDLMEQAQTADPARAARMTEMRDRFAALRDQMRATVIYESGRPTLSDEYLDARADAEDALDARDRLALVRALRAMIVGENGAEIDQTNFEDPVEMARRLIRLDNPGRARHELDAFGQILDQAAGFDRQADVRSPQPDMTIKRGRFHDQTAEDFPPGTPVRVFTAQDSDHERPEHARAATAVRRARNGYVTIREPAGTTVDVFPHQLEPAAPPDEATDRNGPASVQVSEPAPGGAGTQEPEAEDVTPAITVDQLRSGTLNQLGVTLGDAPFAIAGDDDVVLTGRIHRSRNSAVFVGDEGGRREISNRERIRGALLTSNGEISPRYRMREAHKPRRVTEVNAETGEVRERPDLAQSPEERAHVDRHREIAGAIQARDHDRADELLTRAEQSEPNRQDRWNRLREWNDSWRRASNTETEPRRPDAEKRTIAVKRPGRTGNTDYKITHPDGTSKNFSVNRDYSHVRTVDRERADEHRYLSTPHTSENEADKPHPLYPKAPRTITEIVDDTGTPERSSAESQKPPDAGPRPTQEGDENRGPTRRAGAETLAPVAAGPVLGDQGPGEVLPGTGRGRTILDRGDRGRAVGEQRPGAGVPEPGGPTDGREARGGGVGTARADIRRSEQPEGRLAAGAGERRSDRRGSTAGRGVPGRESGPGRETRPAPQAQPDLADAASVDIIPDTGERFRPRGLEDLAPAGERAKLNANLAALRTLRRLQQPDAEERPTMATPEDQAILARWAGWGGLPDVFDESKPKYAAERAELQELLSPKEYNEARRNTLNAHYTDPRAVEAIWTAVADLGFDGGRVLEPGSGSGNFIGYAPDGARMVGVELDSTTAAISKYLYPDAQIRNESFADTRLPDGAFDLTIGNVPFGQFSLSDRRHNKDGESIHNHFILKALALTKPGGLVAVLTSRYTLDSERSAARRKMADMADLVGAVRFPSGAFNRISGTNVIEDLLIFRRREPGAEPRDDQSWLNAQKRDLDGFEIALNDYWDAHPDHVLGEQHGVTGQFGGDLRVVGDMTELPDVLARVVADARAEGLTATPRDTAAADAEFVDPLARHEGHIGIDEYGNFTQAIGGEAAPFDVPEAQREELRGLLGLRDTLRALLDAEAATERNTPEIAELRRELNERYDAHVARYKAINYYELNKAGNRKPNPQGGFRKDPQSAIVRALEIYNADDGTATKTDIFHKRAIAPRETPTSADTPADALTLSLDIRGRIDLPLIAQLLGTDEDDARDRLGDLVFEQPPLSSTEVNAAFQRDATLLAGATTDMNTSSLIERDLSTVGESVRTPGELVTAQEYLSGNVRRKLAAARAAAEHDPRFKPHVDALEAVLPADLTPTEIEGRLGAAWIGAADVKDFLDDLLEIPADRRVEQETRYGHRTSPAVTVSTSGGGIWEVDAPGYGNLAREQWGTEDRSPGELVKAMLEQRPIKITRSVEGPDGKKRSVPDLEATLAAQAKAEAIAERFSSWLWEDADRAQRLQARYNTMFNSIKLRSYDGEKRLLPGKAREFEPFDHQHVAVSRIVNEPAVLLAHQVGAGKTAEMVMGALELKRLGLAKKPSIVVPNHMKEQFEREALQIYPRARILAIGTEDLTGPKRREFVARAATGDWDIVVLTQKAFEAIPMSPERQHEYIDRETAEMRRQLEDAKARAQTSDDKTVKDTVKRMEKALISAEEKLKANLAKGLKDESGVSFEQTGIDYLFVDEAHQYSNLRTLSNIQGAGATGSGMATDLHMKIEHLRQNNASGRVVTFASGTPIRNSVTQAYIMMRYLRPDLLREAGINSFDQWAATFGKIIEEMELKPEGSGFRQTARFAKFQNVPELLQIFHVFADVKMAEDLKLPTPNLIGGRAETVVVPRSVAQAEYIQDLGRRADEVRSGKVDPEVDNMLSVSMDGRKAALSMRLVGGDYEGGKIDVAADRITQIWNETKDRRYPLDPKSPEMGDDPTPGSLQIVFADLGTPGAGEWNAYAELKRQLVERGMSPESIRFMHEAKNDREKAELFAAARSGRISVLIGSTEKMGVGTNVQRRAVHLHHLDAPWRPSDVEQREGRILRQGNLNNQFEGVAISRYVTEGTFDAYMWQTLERKQKFIDQLMRGSLKVREIEDVGDTALNYAEVKALATGNPDLLDKAKVDTLLGKLTRLQRTHENTQDNLRSRVRNIRAQIAQHEQDAAALADAVERRIDISGKSFVAGIGNRRYADRGEAAVALKEAVSDVMRAWGNTGPTKIGEIGGFNLMAHRRRVGSGATVNLSLEGVPGEITSYVGWDDVRGIGTGSLSRISNFLGDFERRRTTMLAANRSLTTEADRMAARIGLPFERREELEAAQAKSRRIQQKMLLDARRIAGEDVPFDPLVDSARYDSPLVGGGTAADAPPDPEGLIEQAEWERALKLRRAQFAHESAAAATAPSGMEKALERVRAALEPDQQHVPGGRATLKKWLELPRDAVYASPDGRVVAAQREDGRWVAFDAATGFNLSWPRWPIDFQGDVNAVLAELAELKIPWGDAGLQQAKAMSRGSRSPWGHDINRQVREIWERHAAPEEKALVVTNEDLLRAQRLLLGAGNDFGLRGFA